MRGTAGLQGERRSSFACLKCGIRTKPRSARFPWRIQNPDPGASIWQLQGLRGDNAFSHFSHSPSETLLFPLRNPQNRNARGSPESRPCPQALVPVKARGGLHFLQSGKSWAPLCAAPETGQQADLKKQAIMRTVINPWAWGRGTSLTASIGPGAHAG